jgi:O-acetylhomoserine/O-acetylserine sulfhydrylase
LLKKFGIHVKFVYSDDPADFAAAIDSKTKAIYIESVGNPKYNVPNIAQISKVRVEVLITRYLTNCGFRWLTTKTFP